jgi:hypothetical protein
MRIDAIYNPNTCEVIDLACYHCTNRLGNLTDGDLAYAIKSLKWKRITHSPGGFNGPFGSWTHLGTCPRCVGMGEE